MLDVNGVAMHAENPDNFQIPPDVIKRHVSPGQFVELRIDSPRFSVHEDAKGVISVRPYFVGKFGLIFF